MSFFNPVPFQGASRKPPYFEGWYFKNVSADMRTIYSFIPGISRDATDPHAFIQVLNGANGASSYVRFDSSAFSYDKRKFVIAIGDNRFAADSIELAIDAADISVHGALRYDGLSPFPSSLCAPGIMGWYSYIPSMECKHAVVSADHSIAGSLDIDGVVHDFGGGTGYIEKDWGTSFPESWIWLQCNNFKRDRLSLFLSVAKIPWLGRFFLGFICFVYVDGRYYTFATYNRSTIMSIDFKDSVLRVSLGNRAYRLDITAVQGAGGHLKAPVGSSRDGVMSRVIKESINSWVEFELFDAAGTSMVRDQGGAAGLEIMERIFSYF
ncbi:MAG TPA: tocopherol cyclase family protein [bacterium]|nr:tocopherol cyclase family protein [bacterium]